MLRIELCNITQKWKWTLSGRATDVSKVRGAWTLIPFKKFLGKDFSYLSGIMQNIPKNNTNLGLNNLRVFLGVVNEFWQNLHLNGKKLVKKMQKIPNFVWIFKLSKNIKDKINQMVVCHRKFDEDSKNGAQNVFRRHFHDVLTS